MAPQQDIESLQYQKSGVQDRHMSRTAHLHGRVGGLQLIGRRQCHTVHGLACETPVICPRFGVWAAVALVVPCKAIGTAPLVFKVKKRCGLDELHPMQDKSSAVHVQQS